MNGKKMTGAILVFGVILLWAIDIGLFSAGMATFSALITSYVGRQTGNEKISRIYAFRIAMISGILSALAVHWLKF